MSKAAWSSKGCVVAFKTISGLAPAQYDLVADLHALAGHQYRAVLAVAHEVGLTLGAGKAVMPRHRTQPQYCGIDGEDASGTDLRQDRHQAPGRAGQADRGLLPAAPELNASARFEACVRARLDVHLRAVTKILRCLKRCGRPGSCADLIRFDDAENPRPRVHFLTSAIRRTCAEVFLLNRGSGTLLDRKEPL